MIDYVNLIELFSTPRPSASSGEQATLSGLLAWLDQRKISYQLQRFRLFPYSNELIGLWLVASVVMLVATVALRLPWPWLLAVGAAMALVITNVVMGWPLVTWLIGSVGENVIMSFDPPNHEPIEREIVITTHYDSKTELFDHTIMGRLFGKQPHCIGLSVAILMLGILDRMLFPAESAWSIGIRIISLVLCIPVLIVVGAVGLNLIPGRFIQQSQGAVDNGAACAIILGLAERIATRAVPLSLTRVTLALFAGEEVSMQGSQAWVRSRSWKLPASVINLELLGQNGAYVIWQREGNVLTSANTHAELNHHVATIVQQVTGKPAQLVGGINSDGYTFVKAGIPTCVLGSYDTQFSGSGLHRPTDNTERVTIKRLPETVQILEALITTTKELPTHLQ